MQLKCHRVVVVCLATLLVAGVACAEQATPPISGDQPSVQLSLARAIELALARNPAPREAAARTAAADARLSTAKALANPTLSLAHWAGHNTGGLDEDIILGQTFEIAGKRSAKISQARSARDAAYSDRASTTVDTVLQVKSAYYEALRADDDLRLADAVLEVAKQFADAARTQYAAGDVPRSNVLRAEVEQSRAEQELTTADTVRISRSAELRSVVGLPEAGDLRLTDELEFSPVTYKLVDLQAIAAVNRPDVKSAQYMVASSRAAVRLARAQMLPDFFIEARRNSVDPAVEGSSIRGGITLPLLDGGLNRAEVADANAVLAEQQARLDEVVRVARLDVETSLNNLNQAKSVVESFETGRLARVKELLDMAQVGYSSGANSYLEVLDAQRVYRSEQADYARALASYNTAVATLERAVGGCLQ